MRPDQPFSLALVALGDGPLSVGIYFKRGD